jgi:hypothetical protein
MVAPSMAKQKNKSNYSFKQSNHQFGTNKFAAAIDANESFWGKLKLITLKH